MKKLYSLIAALAVLTLAATPAIAQTAIKPDGTPTELKADANGSLLIASTTAADNTADAGTTQKVGGVARASNSYTSYAAGTRAPLNLGPQGALRVELALPGGSAAVGYVNNPPDAQPNSMWAMGTASFNYAWNGTTFDRMRGDTNGLVTQPALSSTFWNYAAASGGIVNTTTAVTVKAAGGAGVRNYICTLNVGHDALGAATELAIRDGAAGAVLFRLKLQTAANEGASEITFNPCLRGTANTLMEVVTLTASVTGGVFVNASGYTGS